MESAVGESSESLQSLPDQRMLPFAVTMTAMPAETVNLTVVVKEEKPLESANFLLIPGFAVR